MSTIVVVGSGPIGITAACVLQAANPKLKITVVDKRLEPKRTHGLSIDSDSVNAIQTLLKKSKNTPAVKELKKTLNDWKSQFVRTSDIENTLGEQAKKLGITVLRGPEYELKEGDLERPQQGAKPTTLQAIIAKADAVIAADGAHSLVRQALHIPLKNEETLRHMVEFKFQTEGKTAPRGYKEATVLSSKTGRIAVETLNRKKSEAKKPATFLCFVTKSAYDKLRVEEEPGKLKGVYGNTWNLQELKTLSEQDQEIKEIFSTLLQYIETVKARGASVSQEQIATLELKIYQSASSVYMKDNTPFALIGDASSGLVLQRGFNKGLKEVVHLVSAINDYSKGTSLQDALNRYQQAVDKLFVDERKGIYHKNAGIHFAEKVVSSSYKLSKKSEESSTVVSKVVRFVKTIFSPLTKIF